MTLERFKIDAYKVEHRGGVYDLLHIDIEPTFVERIVPPAGESHAFDVQHYRCRIEVSVSPTGRSVQVYVDGERVR